MEVVFIYWCQCRDRILLFIFIDMLYIWVACAALHLTGVQVCVCSCGCVDLVWQSFAFDLVHCVWYGSEGEQLKGLCVIQSLSYGLAWALFQLMTVETAKRCCVPELCLSWKVMLVVLVICHSLAICCCMYSRVLHASQFYFCVSELHSKPSIYQTLFNKIFPTIQTCWIEQYFLFSWFFFLIC